MTINTVSTFSKSDNLQQDVDFVHEVVQTLRAGYPHAGCGLKYEAPFQLLIATILFTQSTEEKVNQVLSALFAHFPTPMDLVEAHRVDIENIIRPVGFYRQKAKFVQETARIIVESYDSVIPADISVLVQLPGVSRKTANTLLGELYDIAEGISVDTNVHRVANRLELSGGKNATKVENDLMKIVPQEYWIELSHLFSEHGQLVCYPRRPNCRGCLLKDICPSSEV